MPGLRRAMHLRNLPLAALRTFEAAARHLSFKLAAEELCVSAPTVSNQIRRLERDMGRCPSSEFFGELRL